MIPEFGEPHSLSPSVSVQPQNPSDSRQMGLVPTQRTALLPVHSVQAPAIVPSG
jgi:hypothetical protein